MAGGLGGKVGSGLVKLAVGSREKQWADLRACRRLEVCGGCGCGVRDEGRPGGGDGGGGGGLLRDERPGV